MNTSEQNEARQVLTVSASPHMHAPYTTRTLMLDVIIAMLPLTVFAIWHFGWRALTLQVVSVASCILFEYLFELITKKKKTITDLSAIVTGMILAFNMPVSAPLWLPVIGGFFAIVIVKMLFGGLGKNIVNPALAARIFLFLSWASHMSAKSVGKLSLFGKVSVDAVASATPLASLKNGALPEDTTVFDLLLGRYDGMMGEVCSVLILLGFVYLLLRKVITWHIPVAFVGTVALITFALPYDGGLMTGLLLNERLTFMLGEILSGGLLFGAVFMATDYVTSPVTKKARLIFGCGCGLITVFIRYFCVYPEGVSFSILIMNLLVYYLDKVTKPVRFGGKEKKA